MKNILLNLLIIFTIINICACKKKKVEPNPEVIKLALSSSSFSNGDSIPYIFTCKVSKQRFPQLSWRQPDQKMSGYALIMDDPDAVPVVGKVWNHWVLYNIHTVVDNLYLGENPLGPLPAGTFRGTNSAGDTTYIGPCPPVGQKHTYVFTLYGLDLTNLGLPRGATSAQVREAMKGHILDSAVYKGTFER